MAISGSVLSAIADQQRRILPDFRATTQNLWAAKQFKQRYNVDQTSVAGHFASEVFRRLASEYAVLKSWFTSDGRLSPLLMSMSDEKIKRTTLGNGVCYDFDPDLTFDLRVVQFKTKLLTAVTLLSSTPAHTQNTITPLIPLVQSAYEGRSDAHDWRNIPGVATADELSTRWIAMRVYSFFLPHYQNATWLWAATGCETAFGPLESGRQAARQQE